MEHYKEYLFLRYIKINVIIYPILYLELKAGDKSPRNVTVKDGQGMKMGDLAEIFPH